MIILKNEKTSKPNISYNRITTLNFKISDKTVCYSGYYKMAQAI